MPGDVSQFIQLQRLRSIQARQPSQQDKSITHLYQKQIPSSGIAEFLPNNKDKSTSGVTIRKYYYTPGIQTKPKIPGGYVWGNSPFSQPFAALLYAGSPGSSGNSANQFSTPEDLFADSSGNLWVVQGGQQTIRKFTKSTGLITTFATLAGNVNSIIPYSGGFLVSDSSNSSILSITSSGVVSTFGSGLTLSTPTKLAIYGTNLYITDRNNFVVKEVSLSSPTSATAIIGNGSFQPSGFTANNLLIPVASTTIAMGQIEGIAIDSLGNIFIVESSLNRILKYDSATGNIALFAGNNSATTGPNSGFIDGSGFTARFNKPMGLTIDSNNLAIRKITPTGVVSTVITPSLQGANGVFCDKGTNLLYISDTIGTAIYKIQL
jgi:sugar lactone lactonase YvrE